jgi:hypothetical protein
MKTQFIDENTVLVGSHTYSLVDAEYHFTREQLLAVLLARATIWLKQLGDE